MKFKQRLLAVLVTATIATGVAVAEATPAHAAYSDCPPGAICIFDGSTGGWPLYWWTSGGPCIPIGSSWNDRASSVYNRSSHGVIFNRHAGCAGGALVVYPGQTKTFGTGSGLTDWNNIISSIYVMSG